MDGSGIFRLVVFSASFCCQSIVCSDVIPALGLVFIPQPNRKVKLQEVTPRNEYIGLTIGDHQKRTSITAHTREG
jgi:hypothetical protein